jgi:hypothetical protein
MRNNKSYARKKELQELISENLIKTRLACLLFRIMFHVFLFLLERMKIKNVLRDVPRNAELSGVRNSWEM